MDSNRLRAIPVFAALDDEQLRRIATFATERSVAQGDVLVREGDYAEDLMVIEEGRATVSRDGAEVAALGAGDFFGEIAVLDKTRRNATVTAASPMRLVILSHWDLKRIPGAMEDIRATSRARKGEDVGAR